MPHTEAQRRAALENIKKAHEWQKSHIEEARAQRLERPEVATGAKKEQSDGG
jgi:hypothetical protein